MPKVFLDSQREIERLLSRDLDPAGFDGNRVRFVLCDDRGQLLTQCQVDDIPGDISWAECVRIMSTVAHLLSGGALLLVLSRPGPVLLTLADRRWFQAARNACAAHRVRLLGVHVVTPRGHRVVALDDAL